MVKIISDSEMYGYRFIIDHSVPPMFPCPLRFTCMLAYFSQYITEGFWVPISDYCGKVRCWRPLFSSQRSFTPDHFERVAAVLTAVRHCCDNFNGSKMGIDLLIHKHSASLVFKNVTLQSHYEKSKSLYYISDSVQSMLDK